MNLVFILKVIMVIEMIIFIIVLYADIFKHKEKDTPKNMILYAIAGIVINFFDTLGIGATATSMAFFKISKTSPDDHLPGNAMIMFAFTCGIEFLLFLNIIDVDPKTLICMIISAIIGAVAGARFVSRLPLNKVRLVLAIALPCVSVILVCRTFSIGPFGLMGTATSLSGGKLVIGCIFNFIFGVLMNAGVGFYGPCMAVCAMLGMNITVAFPIMMGSAAMLMPPGAIPFIKEGKYNRPAAAVITIAGCIGVYIAYVFVKSMPLTVLTLIVAAVLVYMSVSFVRAIKASKAEESSVGSVTSAVPQGPADSAAE